MPDQAPTQAEPSPASPGPDVTDNGSLQPVPSQVSGPSASEVRLQQRLDGQQPFIEAMLSAGLKTTDDISRAAKAMQDTSFFSERGVDTEVFKQLYPDNNIPSDDEQPLTRKDLEAWKSEMDSKNARKIAEAEYNRLQEAADPIHSSLVSDLSSELFGENHDPFLDVLLKNTVDNLSPVYRDMYEDDHPFKDERFVPLSATSAESLKVALLKQRNDLKAQALAATGDAAQQSSSGPVSAPPAGRSTGQGKPDSVAKTPFHKKSRSEMIQWLEAKQKKQGAATSA